MDFFSVLSAVGGLCLFLFGMDIMGKALERRAGNKLRTILGKMTSGKLAGFLTGCGITAIIQSSSAMTVMVVGFVNSGIMSLRQAINVIMGANIGTTITSWILSLSGIESSNFWINMLKPSSFTPILALIGIILYMFSADTKKKDTGMIFLGFFALMLGMQTMSGSVEGLAESESFRQLLIIFTNPFLGVLLGALLTAIIQSSAASVGMLQALCITGQVTYGTAIPIVMGQNIGTCITAILSSIGTSKNAKRAAFVHLSFNVIGSAVLLLIFSIVSSVIEPQILKDVATPFGVAITHSLFNLLCVVILMPMSGILEKMAMTLIKDDEETTFRETLDERFLNTPSVALGQCHELATKMAYISVRALRNSLSAFGNYSSDIAKSIREDEDLADYYEDTLGTYLIKLSSHKMDENNSAEATELLKVIGDFERISDHAVNILRASEEMKDKGLSLTNDAKREFSVIASALNEILDLSYDAFRNRSVTVAKNIEPLEQVIDGLKETIRTNHILRMQKGSCSYEMGFVWSDLLTNIERTSDHCSNIAGCLIDASLNDLKIHETLRETKRNSKEFNEKFEAYKEKYSLNA